MLAVSNLSRTISGIKLKHGELAVSHEFTKAETDRQECNITNMIKYVLSLENPTCVSSNTERRLHNILTQEILPNDISQDLKNVFQIGTALYKDFRIKRFLDKTEKLSDTIHRRNLKNFNTTHSQQAKQKKADTAKKSKKDIFQAQKLIDLARVRQFGVKELFKYNLVSSSYLFEADGLMKPASKSLLVTELEKYLEDNDYTHPISSPMRTVYLIDVMVDVKQKQTFGDFCKAFLSYGLGDYCHNANEIHFVFDWYKEGTVKDSERSRRYQDMAIDINIMSTITPLPFNVSSFWVSNKIKEK